MQTYLVDKTDNSRAVREADKRRSTKQKTRLESSVASDLVVDAEKRRKEAEDVYTEDEE